MVAWRALALLQEEIEEVRTVKAEAVKQAQQMSVPQPQMTQEKMEDLIQSGEMKLAKPKLICEHPNMLTDNYTGRSQCPDCGYRTWTHE